MTASGALDITPALDSIGDMPRATSTPMPEIQDKDEPVNKEPRLSIKRKKAPSAATPIKYLLVIL